MRTKYFSVENQNSNTFKCGKQNLYSNDSNFYKDIAIALKNISSILMSEKDHLFEIEIALKLFIVSCSLQIAYPKQNEKCTI